MSKAVPTCHRFLAADGVLQGGSHPDLASHGYRVLFTGSIDLSPCLTAGLVLKGGYHSDLASHTRSRLQQSTNV